MKEVWYALALLILLFVSCKPTETPEQVAQKFAIALQQKDYATMYDLIIPELRNQRSKEDFLIFAQAWFTKNNMLLIYDKVVQQDKNNAYTYYVATAGGLQQNMPAINMIKTSEGWKMNTLADLFISPCVDICYPALGKCSEVTCNRDTGYKCVSGVKPDCDCENKDDCPIGEMVEYRWKSYLCKDKRCVLE